MNNHRNPNRHNHHRASLRRWWAGPAAFLYALMALPVAASITIPDEPLTTGVRVAPNILFILDDSGSMNFVAMPRDVAQDRAVNYGGVQHGLQDNPQDRSYLNNTLYYNPKITYQPWMMADGNRMTGGQNIRQVYSDLAQASGSLDLRDNAGSIFYVPKEGVTASTNVRDFVRYRVRNTGGTAAELVGGSVLQTWDWGPNSINSNANGTIRSFSVPAGTVRLEIHVYGSGGGNADLYVRRNANPSTSNYNHRSINAGHSELVVVDNPATGDWRAMVRNSASQGTVYASMSVVAYSDFGVKTPSDRSQADELRNIATWFSYHRTRMKAAKAGASDAFGALDSRMRVGFRTINNKNGGSTSGNWPTHTVPIPVSYNDGRFADEDCTNCDNRTKWYNRLHQAGTDGGTPLRTALNDAGAYFSSSGATGPYGPETGGAQLACRQNFSILTTDGYWNDSFTSDIGNADGTSGSTITGPNDQSYTYVANASENSRFRDNHSNTLADVAMYYWKRDLRPDMENNVPTSDSNPAFWQHMVTFGISIGLSGSRGWSSVSAVPANPNWPEPKSGEASTIDDLLHAAVNSRGAFVSAANPEQFTSGLRESLAAIAQQTSSQSNVAANSVSLDTNSKVFSASYVSGLWTGEVMARNMGPAGVADDVAWTASFPAWGSRKIFTADNGSGTTFPSSTQLERLARTGGPANYEVSGEKNAEYIKGSPELEDGRGTGILRNRSSLLGDIVNSSPAYVSDTDTLYVGANDGMLHAFNAETGREVFAYVPGIVDVETLATLSRGDYVHKFFVDGPVVVSSRALTSSRNVLVGTLGRGGKGLYALDVTAPGSFGATNVKWELADTNTGHMGKVLGNPILAKAGGTAAVVLGNGVQSNNNRAVLIVLDIESGEVLREIDTGVGSAAAPNGLSAPVGVYGLDGQTIQYAYAGDLQGNVWKFDLRKSSPSEWTVTRLFTALDAENRPQPISSAVTLAVDPLTRERWVLFGTGRYLTAEDASIELATTQTMYGFKEGSSQVTRSQLTTRSIEVSNKSFSGFPVRAFEAREALPAGSKGWYIDLPAGERIIQDAQVASGMLLTASMIPSGDACEAGGSGYINAVNAFTGTSSGASYFDLDGKDGSANDLVEGLPIGSVDLRVGMPTLPNLLRGYTVVGGTGGSGLGGTRTAGLQLDRVSWREVRGD